MTFSKVAGALGYAILFIFGLPILCGLIITIAIWAFTGLILHLILLYGTGMIATAIIAYFFIDKIYVYNPPYIVSYHQNPFTGILNIREDDFHFIWPWEIFDSYTRHEKEIKIDLKEGQTLFETFGEDALNLNLPHAQLVLKIPMSEARILRAIGKGTKEIEEEIIEQLRPSLEQAISAEVAQYTAEDIMRYPQVLAQLIIDRFTRETLAPSEYAAFPAAFALGNIGFSDEVNDARETRFTQRQASESVKELKKVGVTPDLAYKTTMGSLHGNSLDVHIYDVSGLGSLGNIGQALGNAAQVAQAVRPAAKTAAKTATKSTARKQPRKRTP